MTERGFFHPDRGYWQITGWPPVAIVESWPDGWREVAVRPQGSYVFDPGTDTWLPADPVITHEEVDAERARRIDLGAEFTLSDGMVIAITGRQQDQTVLLGSSIAAQSLAVSGETNPVMVYRDRDNQIRNLTPLQMIELYTKGLTWITTIMQVSWAMKDGTGPYSAGIPSDYTDDSHWPDPA
ncbi:hypothetical protein [Roseibium album]|uniref:DUF4376 domain-containing protein n=1 Tax=Roseibium album TaxID=311410 RepID=UPI003919EB8E